MTLLDELLLKMGLVRLTKYVELMDKHKRMQYLIQANLHGGNVRAYTEDRDRY